MSEDIPYKLSAEYSGMKHIKTVAKPPKMKPIKVSSRESMAVVVPGSHSMARRCFNPWFLKKHWKVPKSKMNNPQAKIDKDNAKNNQLEVTMFPGTDKQKTVKVKRTLVRVQQVLLEQDDPYSVYLLYPTETCKEHMLMRTTTTSVEVSRGYKTKHEAVYTYFEGRAKWEVPTN